MHSFILKVVILSLAAQRQQNGSNRLPFSESEYLCQLVLGETFALTYNLTAIQRVFCSGERRACVAISRAKVRLHVVMHPSFRTTFCSASFYFSRLYFLSPCSLDSLYVLLRPGQPNLGSPVQVLRGKFTKICILF